ncbi:MAG: hypothetical protein JGK17_13190 [Microcoleus sp. PH2017_10_PVI_O_A]|uniref:hypothetical protein n=1 Tax=unclassified Microcoleus TaxID=2642155 RepID=UPI001D985EA8|nr:MULTISPECIES: hypothetical protein [unclassified Microcoleus]TAE80265.1 MAG: hypothetical protein EAZ83_18895 [Oscillatoriales cyanobacterium]MCC3406517.1 hypothetical protein [Microcoleus sp. PH2017_10_PVI_O_A]MCC3460485.1 hypothetical protein [Microcoleus sp. PH2017_11_PCY_U_A]MCC3478902.1 hypothetical protein [Microcoleus sp. PH2017_12_PCY_D_A]MCC3529281.1 hypothetical protein [Microcoleus sp. PH2017_21_RUC_O_A]
MFGFIKNFFGGIFGFFAGLLGLNKSEYFLDLGESPAKVEPTKAEPAAAKKAEPVAAAPASFEPVKSEKSEPAKKAKVEKKSKKEKEPVASAAAKTAEPAKVPAAGATNGKVSSQAQPVLTFAPNNLMPTPTATRRGPGPSMNNFREMARQVKTK